MPYQLSHRLHALIWLGVFGAFLFLLYELSPILTPFLLAAILAYICDPLVERLEAYRVPRSLGTALVIVLLILMLTLLVVILVPLVQKEVTALAARLPGYLAAAQERLTPWLREQFHVDVQLDLSTLRQLITENWDSAQDVAKHLLQSARTGGAALFTVLAIIILVPVVMFYLLRDWNHIGRRIGKLIPRPWFGRAMRILMDVDSVLAEFLRGQLLVMLILAVYYSAGLWIAGIEFALPVGILTGLLIVIPYVGYGIGLILALLVAVLQFQGIGIILAVLVVYGIGQVLEGFLLTPFLVGERIGLHPLAVIFALLAFGQLFGFIGVLIALPTSAALLVGLREMRSEYLRSPFYLGKPRGPG